MTTHTYQTLYRIKRRDEDLIRCADIWKVKIDGIETEVIYSYRLTSKNANARVCNYLKFSNKGIRKHKDYKVIRHNILALLYARYPMASGSGDVSVMNEIVGK